MSVYEELAGKVAVITGAGRAKGLGEAMAKRLAAEGVKVVITCLLYTSPSPRDRTRSRMPSSA